MRSFRSVLVAILLLGIFSLAGLSGCGGSAPGTIPVTEPGSAPSTEPGTTPASNPTGVAKPRLILFTQPG